MKKIKLCLFPLLFFPLLSGCSEQLKDHAYHFVSVDTSLKNVELKVVSKNKETFFAQEGDLLFINALFDYGYELDYFLLNDQKLDSSEFVMPKEDAFISAVVKHVVSPIHLLESYNHGEIRVDKDAASFGDAINITVIPEEGYMCLGNSIKANTTPLYRSPIKKETTFSFFMPSEEITIYAEFGEITL